MKVLMVTAPLPTGSEARNTAQVVSQIESIRALGVEADVLQVRGSRRLKYVESFRPFLKRAARADVIHAHYGFCGWVSRLQVRKPVVVSFMGSDLLGVANAAGQINRLSKLVVEIDRALARVVDAVIVKSREMADVVRPVVAHVIPNGVDLERFRPIDRRAARRSLGWGNDARRVMFPGNPATPNKGFPLARRSVAFASALLDEPIELVPLWGVLPQEVPLYVNACDALLMTSFTEGSPNAVKEAMACNLPVVSVPVGDVRDLLTGVTNCRVSTRDPEGLGTALAAALKNPDPSDGRAQLRARSLDLESVARRVVTVYEEVVR
jgi:glycosyltransferase involved in cell wall biosynthesis